MKIFVKLIHEWNGIETKMRSKYIAFALNILYFFGILDSLENLLLFVEKYSRISRVGMVFTELRVKLLKKLSYD